MTLLISVFTAIGIISSVWLFLEYVAAPLILRFFWDESDEVHMQYD